MPHGALIEPRLMADEIEAQIEEAANMGEPPSFALARHQADWLVMFLRTAIRHREKEHLQMQIGYLAGQLQILGDKRSTPEIVETAARATEDKTCAAEHTVSKEK